MSLCGPCLAQQRRNVYLNACFAFLVQSFLFPPSFLLPSCGHPAGPSASCSAPGAWEDGRGSWTLERAPGELGTGRSLFPPLRRTGAHPLHTHGLDAEFWPPRVSQRLFMAARKLEECGLWIQTKGNGVQLLCDPGPATQHLSLSYLICKM